MKRNILIIISLFLGLAVNAQQIKQEVIASAGGYNKSADNSISISWTLGETIIPTFTSEDGSLILTHGFQQKLIITTVEENLEDLVEVTIYPNPTSEMINIQFQTSPDKEILVYLLDAAGKLVKTDRIDVAMMNKTINMQDLPAGLYYLRLTKGKLINVYKVVKL
jgi:2',3'-cyclic-nucleotide 2'-phosphodiesterase (5'-nucleotidase family)